MTTVVAGLPVDVLRALSRQENLEQLPFNMIADDFNRFHLGFSMGAIAEGKITDDIIRGEKEDADQRQEAFYEGSVGDKHATPSLPDHATSILVAVTSCNMFPLTRRILFSLAHLGDRFHLLVIDDGSSDNTTSFLREMHIPHLALPRDLESGGLARSWNAAWSFFQVLGSE